MEMMRHLLSFVFASLHLPTRSSYPSSSSPSLLLRVLEITRRAIEHRAVPSYHCSRVQVLDEHLSYFIRKGSVNAICFGARTVRLFARDSLKTCSDTNTARKISDESKELL